jgi:acetamidase/formamidase
VLAVDPGDSVRIAVPDAGWELDSGEEFQPRDETLDAGHALAGPIEVRGALAGQTLVVRIDEVRPGPWGVTFGHPSHRLQWELKGELGRTGGRTVRLAPFLGVLGMPPDEPGVHTTGPPRACGGNIDCKELVAGTTLFLPIPVDGALFSAGDGHAAQGDGEVSGTAIECPARAQLTLDLRDDLPLTWPTARIDGAWLTFGFHEHLGRAARIAVDGMLELMQREHGLEPGEALALASVVVDLRVTQVVNGSLGVHAVLRDDAWQ